MAKEPDVSELSQYPPEEIRDQIEETRSSLTDKLESLEHEVRETVRNATSAVVDTVENVKNSVESTIESVKQNVSGTVDSVKETLNVSHHVEQHPWAVMGGAFAIGALAGSLVPSRHPISRAMSRSSGFPGGVYPAPEPHAGRGFQASQHPASNGPSYAGETHGDNTGLLGHLFQQFQPEIDKLKGMAIGAAVGMVRDLVKQSVPPNFASQLEPIMDSITTKLGGHPISGPVLVPSPNRPQ